MKSASSSRFSAVRRPCFFVVNAAAQEGYYGVGHDKWHQGFYSKLKRNDGQGSCCNLMDCRPTQKPDGWRPLRS